MDEEAVFNRAEERIENAGRLLDEWKKVLWEGAMDAAQRRDPAMKSFDGDYSGEFSEFFLEHSTTKWTESIYTMTKEKEERAEDRYEDICSNIMHEAEDYLDVSIDITDSDEDSEEDEEMDPEDQEGDAYVFEATDTESEPDSRDTYSESESEEEEEECVDLWSSSSDF